MSVRYRGAGEAVQSCGLAPRMHYSVPPDSKVGGQYRSIAGYGYHTARSKPFLHMFQNRGQQQHAISPQRTFVSFLRLGDDSVYDVLDRASDLSLQTSVTCKKLTSAHLVMCVA